MKPVLVILFLLMIGKFSSLISRLSTGKIDRTEALFSDLWKDYTTCGPTPRKVHNLFLEAGNVEVVNDHVAFRTYNLESIGLDKLGQHFVNLGYEEAGFYEFEEKKLYAKHFEKIGHPLVFISELRVELFPEDVQDIIKKAVEQVDEETVSNQAFLTSGRPWKINTEEYNTLMKESEYAAWMYVFGFRVNHFTVSVNHLETFDSVVDVNTFLKDSGFRLNDRNGEVKGSEEILLEQSSTMADIVEIEFEDGKLSIPSCYYEFAKRYPKEDGTLFTGFHAKSADKIFESTFIDENDEL